jgi:hypothetical protein
MGGDAGGAPLTFGSREGPEPTRPSPVRRVVPTAEAGLGPRGVCLGFTRKRPGVTLVPERALRLNAGGHGTEAIDGVRRGDTSVLDGPAVAEPITAWHISVPSESVVR